MKNLLKGLTILSLTVGLAVSSGSAIAQEKRIGFMIWNTSVPFYSNLIKTAEKTAAENNIDLDIQSGNGDLSNQISVVQQFIAQNVDMIMIAPSDPKGIVPVVKQANAAGIPVMAVNTKADIDTGADIITYVGVDDFVFGQKQGELLVEAVSEEAKVAYIVGKLGTSAQLAREAGLMDTLAKYPGVEIVAKQAADWDNAKALAITQDFLSRYPEGTLDAIVGQGPESVTGAIFAGQNDRSDVTFIIGDYPADVRKAIQDGYAYGTVNQDPAPQGRVAIEDAVLWFEGRGDEIPSPNHHLPLPKIDQSNVEDYQPAWGG